MSNDVLPDADTAAREALQASKPEGDSPQPRDFWERCMMLAVGVPGLWRKRPAFVRSFDDMRQVMLNVLIFGIGGIFLFVVGKATLIAPLVIEPIAVPKQLEERGYSGIVVAQQLLDQINAIDRKATTTKERVRFDSEASLSTLSAIQVPTTGLTLRSVVAALRQVFGRDGEKISGEITINAGRGLWDSKLYSLLLRFDKAGERTTWSYESDDFDDVMQEGAWAIFAQFDPYVLGSYFFVLQRWAEVDRIADRLIRSADPDLIKYGLVLRGTRMGGENTGESVELFERAVAIDRTFAPAYYNWAVSLEELDRDRSEIIEKYDAAIRYNPRYAAAYYNRGLLFQSAGNLDRAIADLRKAVEFGPTDGNYQTHLGKALAQKRDYAGAMEHLSRAMILDPVKYGSHADQIKALKPQKEKDAAAAVMAMEIFWQRGWTY